MRLLWDMVRVDNGRLRLAREALRDYRSELVAFRRIWGADAPHTEGEWLNFWHEFSLIEDKVDAVIIEMASLSDDLDTTSLSATEIIRKHGVEGDDTDPLGSLEHMMDRLTDMVTN